MFEEAKWDLWIVRFEGRVSSCDYSPSQLKDDLSWSKSTPVLSKIIKQGISIIMITTSEEKCNEKLWETVVYPRGFLQKTVSRLVCWAAGLPPHCLGYEPCCDFCQWQNQLLWHWNLSFLGFLPQLPTKFCNTNQLYLLLLILLLTACQRLCSENEKLRPSIDLKSMFSSKSMQPV